MWRLAWIVLAAVCLYGTSVRTEQLESDWRSPEPGGCKLPAGWGGRLVRALRRELR